MGAGKGKVLIVYKCVGLREFTCVQSFALARVGAGNHKPYKWFDLREFICLHSLALTCVGVGKGKVLIVCKYVVGLRSGTHLYRLHLRVV